MILDVRSNLDLISHNILRNVDILTVKNDDYVSLLYKSVYPEEGEKEQTGDYADKIL